MPWLRQLARIVGNRCSQVHVARREVGERVAGHDAYSARVDKKRTLAAHRLRNQRLAAQRPRAEPQYGRMELNELKVSDFGAAAEREGHAVARGHLRVGGSRVDLAEAPGREHHGARVHRADPVALPLAHHVQAEPGGAAVRAAQQVEHQRVLDHLEARVSVRRLLQRRDKCAGYLGSGGITAGVRDAAPQVTSLAREGDRPVASLVEPRAHFDEAPHRRRAFGHEHPGRRLVAQAAARRERVAEVLARRVARAERGGDPALGPSGRPGVGQGLGDKQHAARPARRQRRREARDAGPGDHDVRTDRPARRCGRQPGRDRCHAVVRGMNSSLTLSIRRVEPTHAATASTAWPA